MVESQQVRRLLSVTGTSVLILLGCSCLWVSRHGLGERICREAPYSAPPAALHDADLVGTWQASYGKGSVDSITLRADGSFRQVYSDPAEGDYLYETPWNRWWLEHGPDNLVRLHLEGARYYVGGIDIAEREGMEPELDLDSLGSSGPYPAWFYDPFAEEHLFMVGELTLNVRVDSSHELLLHHLWTHHDRGFPLYGCQSEQFRRVDAP